MNAIVVNFKNSVPTPQTSDYFKVMFGYFLQNLNLWVDEYDKVYVIDSDWNFSEEEKDKFYGATNHKGIIVKANPNTPYMTSFKQTLQYIQEDKVLFMHEDTIIYKKGFVKKIFDNLEEYDVVSAFEEIGTLTARINKRWSVMNGYSNFATALFGFKLDILKPFSEFQDEATYKYEPNTYIPELDYYTIDGDWLETLGRETLSLLDLGAKVLQIPQDKSYLYFQTPPAVEKNNDTEWHHVRYWAAAPRLLANKNLGWPEEYQKEIQQPMIIDNLRRLAWYWIANKNPYFSIPEERIWEVLEDVKISKEDWLDYIEKFKKFHSLEVEI
jgi:hypothetical protein